MANQGESIRKKRKQELARMNKLELINIILQLENLPQTNGTSHIPKKPIKRGRKALLNDGSQVDGKQDAPRPSKKFKTDSEKCQTCGKPAHDFQNEEIMECVPPAGTLKFGNIEFDKDYRDALYDKYPWYTTEEVVGSYLGHNPHFPSQDDWLDEQDYNSESSS
mmetsp:Transcript_12928/g.19616  ORF Transcript_12928/g.19616 Transcript_12928/m.19616 type:complete len:164 (-) Transcript_12928:111-602(-)|eukprot:CAMPEP_0202712858 /NCGR_PEP_ID=MMETSP1385-20130828/46640_1 /ASSEMBLY_ACC=CAM_ASM_000861 /TAXON_ID=933848 /ORGANISM="Elphidium margaritaceum" /LENGTH=163 /DNA_ID=CAMNT_0049373027 /DNA_START=52 /DNA_END=543 /DNA_ORIENTATION=+